MNSRWTDTVKNITSPTHNAPLTSAKSLVVPPTHTLMRVKHDFSFENPITSPVSPHDRVDTPAPSEKIVRNQTRNKRRPRDGSPEQRQ
uniref:Uncharacterized protein n=2 Tax=Timema TaxID=61471 RepID=A0A7R9FF32_9NEOP|nr:unnamed protein product [Timema bartmani]CAD7452417.1 unnamed protein product [Timema tahoe]